MNDYIVRMVAKEAGLRGLACVTTNLVKEGAQRHEASPTATAALGHILTAGVLMGTLLKVQQRVAIKVQGNGPLTTLIVCPLSSTSVPARQPVFVSATVRSFPDSISPRSSSATGPTVA